ncbi:MAG: hypothetical protein Salg2KO_20140 [Salibacteraceae bacterium]
MTIKLPILFSLGCLAFFGCKKEQFGYQFMPTFIYGIDMSSSKALLYIDGTSHGPIINLNNRVRACNDDDMSDCYYVELPFDCHNFEVRDHKGNILVSHILKFTETRLKNCSPFNDKVKIQFGKNNGWILSTVFEDSNGRHTCLMEFSNKKQKLKGFAQAPCQ